ncbi:D-amino-acid transaminase [candidate division KSB3 bacterium]|uniref:D-alanine aminotransferase n=1 Tax=candidate division KSB3 bacterium TaxID=2044937 RepID=A0A2G6KKD0_9BACT|nr:MAG: D-amino-acid transaminase [candidate division KSB3 bacterium]
MIAYYNGQFLPKEEIKISPDDRGFLFADGVYEVVVSYKGKFFRFDEHLQRMQRGLRELRINFPNPESLKHVAETLIKDNQFEAQNAKVYVQITRGAAPRSHAFPPQNVSPTVYATASLVQLSQEPWQNGVKVILVPDIRWARCDIKSTGLLPNTMAFQQAKECGAHEAVFVRDGVVTEGAHTNFCAVYDGTLFTAPSSNYILTGMTRNVVLDLCRELRIPIREFPVFEKDLPRADECMIVGTTTEVTPVVQIDGWTVGDGKPGSITRRLQQAFQELAHPDA